jgi:hypothetical protein
MALTFPSSPSVGQVFSSATRSWAWDGTTWVSIPTTQKLSTKSGNYTLAAGDAESLITFTAAATCTIPLNATVPFTIGTRVDIAVLAAVTIGFTFTGGITAYYTPGTNLMAAAGSMATLQKIGTDTWILAGALVT